MRKLVWCGAALLVGGAVAVYMAAGYASRHPESYLGRCAAAAAYLGAHSNPFSVAGGMVHRHCTQGTGQVGGGTVAGVVGCDPEHGGIAGIHKPVGAGEAVEERVEVREPAEAAEVVEPIHTEVLPQGGSVEYEVPFSQGEVIPVVPMQTDEPASASESRIEYGVSAPSSYYGGEGTTSTPPNPEGEEVVPEILPMPAEDETGDDETVSEASGTDQFDTQSFNVPFIDTPADKPCESAECAGCCWFGQMLKMSGLCHGMPTEESATVPEESTAEASPVAETATEAEMLPMPIECDDDEAQDEGVEERDLEQTQTCPQTDSYYHHHHNSCPYMGCPYPYSRPVPAVTPVETPKKGHTRKKIKQSMKDPTSLELLWKTLFLDNEVSVQTGVDTMEFRPSDDPRDPPGRSPF